MENFKIYSNMDKVDVKTLSELAGSKTWPKSGKFTVNCNGVEIKIQNNIAKSAKKVELFGYDAYSAIESMIVRELTQEEIRWETDGKPQFADPEFVRANLKYLDNDQQELRLNFTMAIANLINNQQTMEAIAAGAQKKKNGTLYKGRLFKIACSGSSGFMDTVYALIARAKTDDTLVITFEEIKCKPGDNEMWANDFISTYHEGLPVSEALKKIF